MISTITTATASAAGNLALMGSLGLVAVVALILLLVQKEILAGSASHNGRTLARVLNVAIVPLLVVFAVVVVSRLLSL
jgi:hypothetical protein